MRQDKLKTVGDAGSPSKVNPERHSYKTLSAKRSVPVNDVVAVGIEGEGGSCLGIFTQSMLRQLDELSGS